MQFLKINFIKYLLTLATVFFTLQSHAQDMAANNDIEMADAMRADGKIYVVVVCLLLIFAGIVTYLIVLNNKVNKLEKLINQK